LFITVSCLSGGSTGAYQEQTHSNNTTTISNIGIAEAGDALNIEVERLSEGVDFRNQSEVAVFERALSNSIALKNYMAATREEGYVLSENEVIEELVRGRFYTQLAQRSEQTEQTMYAKADEWATGNVTSGEILFDLFIQQRIKSDFGNVFDDRTLQSKLRQYTNQYSGKTILYIGMVNDVSETSISLYRTDGAHVGAYFNATQADSLKQIKAGDVIVLSGKCSRFMESSSSIFYIGLQDSEIRYMVK
jgi:hypothetical protein